MRRKVEARDASPSPEQLFHQPAIEATFGDRAL
jgi:hypothetical protein